MAFSLTISRIPLTVPNITAIKATMKSAIWAREPPPGRIKSCRALLTFPFAFLVTYCCPLVSVFRKVTIRLQSTEALFPFVLIPRGWEEPAVACGLVVTVVCKICGAQRTTLFESKMPGPISALTISIRTSPIRGACKNKRTRLLVLFLNNSSCRWKSRINCLKGLPRLGRFNSCTFGRPSIPAVSPVPLFSGSRTYS